MKKCILVFLFITLLPAFAFGDDSRFSKKFDSCVEQAAGRTIGNLDCISDELEIQDQRLNVAYRELMKVLPEDRKQALREAQRAWLKFRQSYADFLINPDGGTINIVMRADSFLELTADQADLLEAELARAREEK